MVVRFTRNWLVPCPCNGSHVEETIAPHSWYVYTPTPDRDTSAYVAANNNILATAGAYTYGKAPPRNEMQSKDMTALACLKKKNLISTTTHPVSPIHPP